MSLENAGIERELEAHAVWVRALARSLVGDSSLADDVAQETWLVALQSAPRQPGRMRSWLAGIARRLAARQGSRERRTQGVNDAQAEAPRGEPLANLEQLELHAILVDELRALREPLRTTLLERYFEGLSAAEIAARSGVPAPTVRWRLQQGLEELRTRLDRRFGERNTWMSALAFALPVKEAATVGGVGIGGGLLMSTLVKLSLGAAALVAAVLIVRPFLPHDVELPSPPALANSPVPGAEQPGGDSHAVLAEFAPTARTEVASAVASTTNAKPAAATETLVVARFLDEQQRPIANAWLRHANTRRELILPYGEELARSGADGVATIHWSAEDVLSTSILLVAGADGFSLLHLRCTAREGQTVDLGDLVLRPGGCVQGRVIDTAQHPIAHAIVLAGDEQSSISTGGLEALRNRGPRLDGLVHAIESDADGQFRLQGIPVGTTRVWARSGDLRWAVSAPLEIEAAAQPREVLLVVDASDSADPELADLEGIVVDPDGKPVANPRIDASQRHANESWTELLVGGADGRFVVHPKSRGVAISLEIHDAEERFVHALLAKLAAGTKNLEVRLQRSVSLVLSATDEHGPVERFRVRAGDEQFPQGDFLDADVPHDQGHVSVRVPSESTWYYVDAPGHTSAKLGPIDGRAPPPGLDVVLTSVPCLRGRVLDGDRPVVGAKLRFCTVSESARGMSGGFQTYVTDADEQKSTTDEEGRFCFGIAAKRVYCVYADAEGFARGQYGPIELSPDAPPDEVTLALDAGGTLEGKVLMPEGHSAAGVIVGINRGDGSPRTQTVGADGAFRFEHLSAGGWELQRALDPQEPVTFTISGSGRGDPPVRLRDDFRIEVGKTTHKDLDLRVSTSSVLEIELRHNGAPARGWSVQLRPKKTGTVPGGMPRTTIDAAGHARLEAQFEGECELRIAPPGELGSALLCAITLSVHGGSNTWGRDVETGRVEGTITDGTPDSKVEWLIAGRSDSFPLSLHPDAKGHFVEPLAPAGSVTIQRQRWTDTGLQSESVQSFELGTGATKTIVLP